MAALESHKWFTTDSIQKGLILLGDGNGMPSTVAMTSQKIA